MTRGDNVEVQLLDRAQRLDPFRQKAVSQHGARWAFRRQEIDGVDCALCGEQHDSHVVGVVASGVVELHSLAAQRDNCTIRVVDVRGYLLTTKPPRPDLRAAQRTVSIRVPRRESVR